MEDECQEYRRVLQHDGVRTTISTSRFEISVMLHGEVWEQEAVALLRDWVRWRKNEEKLRESGDLPA